MKPVMIRRAEAAQKTLDKFRDRPFALGKWDCGQMVLSHLRLLRRPVKGAKGYKTALEAKANLKALGYSSLAEMLDANFERYPSPSFAVVGDIIEMPGEGGLSGLAIALGNGRACAYHPDAPGAAVLQPVMMSAAWKVL